MPPTRSNVRLLCLLALLHLGVGPLVILTLSCATRVAQPVLQAVVSPSHEVRADCRAAVEHFLDEVAQYTLGAQTSQPSAPSSKDPAKIKTDKAKLWAWLIITAPPASLSDLPDPPPPWCEKTWTPTRSLAPPGPPPRLA